jgi:hypothetical protein
VEILPPGPSDKDAIARALTRSSNRKGPFNAVEIWDGGRIVFRGPLSEATSGGSRPRPATGPPFRQTQNDVAGALSGASRAAESATFRSSQIRMSPASRREHGRNAGPRPPHIAACCGVSLSALRRPVSFFRVSLSSSPSRPPAWAGYMRSSTTGTEDGSRVTLWSRYGTNFTDRLPKIAEAVCSLAAESALIDGEAVAVRPDGHSDFAALRTKAGSARACFVAFDLLNLNGEDFRQRPLERRRAALSPLVAGVHRILFNDALVAEGALVFGRACELGLEGIVSKRAGSRYSSGNSRQCLKSKNPAFLRE